MTTALTRQEVTDLLSNQASALIAEYGKPPNDPQESGVRANLDCLELACRYLLACSIVKGEISWPQVKDMLGRYTPTHDPPTPSPSPAPA